MEIVLLLAVVIMLIFVLKGQSDKAHRLELMIRDLTTSVDSLKKRLAEKNPEPAQPTVSETRTAPEPAQQPKPESVPQPKPAPAPVADHTTYQPQPIPASPAKPATDWEPKKSRWEQFKDKNPDLEKFIGENLINKIGILILVLGVSYFVKFAIDKDWINEPARVGIGVLAGALVMWVAHRLRRKYAPFSSVLVAGAISILYFTIGIAFHDYHLLGQTAAFLVMTAITAFSCLVSVNYNRVELGVLSLVGGFAVPFMVSTGQGNYVVLFTYIAILDSGILAIAYFRKWNLLNVLSYVFTVLLFAAWLYEDRGLAVPHHAGALGFAFVFYLIFIGVSIIHNIRMKGAFSATELAMLSSNTFLFFTVGMLTLSPTHPELKGVFTTALAALNMGYAWLLYKKFGLDRTAVYLLIGLTMSFATLAVPIQFKGHYITLFWAAEAAILMWLGQQARVAGYRFGALLVHVLTIISLIMDWSQLYGGRDLMMVFNPAVATGLTAALSFAVTGWLLRRETETVTMAGIDFVPGRYRNICLGIAVTLAYVTGLLETYFQSHAQMAPAAAGSLTALYHMAFSFVVAMVLRRSASAAAQVFKLVLCTVNVVLYAFGFVFAAFAEHRQFIAGEILGTPAFWLHFALLAIAVYFAVEIYLSRRGKWFPAIDKPLLAVGAALLLIYLSSTELMLIVRHLSNTPVTATEVSQLLPGATDNAYAREELAAIRIGSVTGQVVKTGFPVLWGVIAFLLLLAGIRKPSKTLRITALSLLGLTIVKLFVYDIRNASETGKIIAFILLGVLILIISFVYQKIKLLVIDDTSKPKPDA